MYGPILGHTWEDIRAMQQGTYKPAPIKNKVGDIGADPLGDGTFKMVPSGDVVNYEERCRRLLGH